MNCNELSEIHIGDRSFYWYESLELKNLPSLTVLEMGRASFCNCHWIVVENLNRLQSITLALWALHGGHRIESNELIMKNLPSLTLFKGDTWNFNRIQKMSIKNIPSLTSEGIQMKG
ncbi:hypothetical protein WA171_006559 [Blastocystis sp. BT1]